MNIYKQRLLNVARALREAKRPKAFCMWGFSYQSRTRNPMNRSVHPCGTPMCALGHYASREDLQDEFKIDQVTGITYAVSQRTRADGLFAENIFEVAQNIFEVAQKHFCLSARDTDRLFSSNGCGGARSKTAAIRFVRAFAEKKWPEPKVRIRVKAKVREAVAA